ncbi:MAG: HAMP domain-containing protein [Candidatus Riflebacteria bacterium]|nr:HAMP domain-containing protein [Candidatus Riflebacteria bacterium]
MYISLRIKVISLLFILISSLALIINESSTRLIQEKTREIFQQRIELLLASIKSYWDSEKNLLLNNAILYSESEKIINYSTYGLNNMLQHEVERLISKTGFYDLEMTLVSGQIVSSNQYASRRGPPINRHDTLQNLSWVTLQEVDGALFVRSEVPVHKLGEFIGRLALRRKIDDTRLKRMARNLQAEVSMAVKEKLLASSLPGSSRQELALEHFRNNDRKEDIFTLKLGMTVFSIGRVIIEKTVENDPVLIYLAVSQEKMLSLVEEAQWQNFSVTAWILIATLLLSIIFSEKVLISRIRQIRDGANIIAEGDLSFQISSVSSDELGNLARSFNRMASNLKQNQDRLQHYIERIEKLANYIQNILGSLRTCVITWNLRGHIETANNAATQELSEFYPELEGLSLRSFVKKLKPQSRLDMLAALRRVGDPEYDRQFDIEFEQGEYAGTKVLQGSFSTLLGNDKKPYGIILTLTNITQRKIIEQQLYHADKLSSIGQLAASVAHEIKNPLASIKTLGQLLQEETEIDDSRREYIDVIVSEVNRLNGVVEQLLKYARPEGSSFCEIAFAEVIKPVLALVRHESDRHQVALESDYQDELKVFVDPEKIKQVFLNLIVNAIQSMEKGGKVFIRAFKEEDSLWTVFEVEDNGCGMPEETTGRIFEPFFTTRQRGTGLGLAIVKKIVDLHGGKIEVTSAAGRGTKFKFYLPGRQEG